MDTTFLCGAYLIFHAIIFLSLSNCTDRLESSFLRGNPMDERKKSVIRLFAAAALLLAVSAYRQLSMQHWPEDSLRPYLVWAVYMLLLFGWQYTISTKNHTEIHALSPDCPKYRQYPIFGPFALSRTLSYMLIFHGCALPDTLST